MPQLATKDWDDNTPRKYWMGSTHGCDLCKGLLGDHLYDSKIRGRGCWATMCKRCWGQHGEPVGQGSCQHYVLQDDGRFLKVEI